MMHIVQKWHGNGTANGMTNDMANVMANDIQKCFETFGMFVYIQKRFETF